MKASKNIIAVILVIMFFGGIGLSKALNLWSTESSKVPAVFNSGEFSGKYNPADIRGSYSFNDIEKSFNIPVVVMAKAFGIENKNPADFQCKDLETKYSNLENEIGTGSVRLFVALYTGLPYSLEGEDTYLPDTAVSILKENAKLTQEQLKYLETHSVKIQENSTASSETKSEEEKKAITVNGQTTFKELLDSGIERSAIEDIIGGKIPQTGMTVRDYCLDKGVEFSTVKSKLQAMTN